MKKILGLGFTQIVIDDPLMKEQKMELDENGVPVQVPVVPIGKPKRTVRAGITKNKRKGQTKTRRKMAEASVKKNRK